MSIQSQTLIDILLTLFVSNCVETFHGLLHTTIWKRDNGLVQWQVKYLLHTASHHNYTSNVFFMSIQSQILIDNSFDLLVSNCMKTFHVFLYTTIWKSNNGLVQWQVECLHTASHDNHSSSNFFMSIQSQTLIYISLASLVSNCVDTCHGLLYTTIWKSSNNALLQWQAECLHTAPHGNHTSSDFFMSIQSQMLIDISLALLVSNCVEICHGLLYTTIWKSSNNDLMQWQAECLHTAPHGNHTSNNFFMSIQSQMLIDISWALLVQLCGYMPWLVVYNHLEEQQQ